MEGRPWNELEILGRILNLDSWPMIMDPVKLLAREYDLARGALSAADDNSPRGERVYGRRKESLLELRTMLLDGE